MSPSMLHKRNVHRRLAAHNHVEARFFPTVTWDTAGNTNPTTTQPPAAPTQPVVSTPAAQPATTSNLPPESVVPSPATSATPVTSSVTSPLSNTSLPVTSSTPSTTSVSTTSSTPITTTPTSPTVTPVTSSPQVPTTALVYTSNALVTETFTPVAASGIVSPSPSASSTTTTTSSISTGAIIGGVVAGIVAIAAIIFAVTYFMRRANREEEDLNFDADAFRRQSAVLLDDDHIPRGMGANRGYGGTNPHNPPIFQQRANHGPPVSYGNQPNYGYQAQPSFNPGEVINMNNGAPSGHHYPQDLTIQPPNSATAFFSPMGQSPIGSPVSVAPYGSAYNKPGDILTRQPSSGASAVLSRQPSQSAMVEGEDMDLAPPEAHYVDLNRSSVSPFQAQQYAEISKQLNTTPPVPLPPAKVETIPEEASERVVSPKPVPISPLEVGHPVAPGQTLAAKPEQPPPESPFADPQIQQQDDTIVEDEADDDQGEEEGSEEGVDSFPQPPTAAFSKAGRINSTPPVLPEIHIQNRAFSPVSMEFIGPSSARASPTPSSPLSQSANLPSPVPEAHLPRAPPIQSSRVNVSSPLARSHQEDTVAAVPNKRPDTVYTVYDDEDAYGGI